MVHRATERNSMLTFIIWALIIIASVNSLLILLAGIVYIIRRKIPLVIPDDDPELIWQREQTKKMRLDRDVVCDTI